MKRDDLKNSSLTLAAGFSLVELIVVIVIVGIVAGAMGMLITRPIQGYVDLSRRAALVDAAESALRRMARDIRIALPNSVRTVPIGAGYALEILPTLDGGRYSMSAGVPSQDLNIGGADTDFNILGCFQYFTIPASPGTFVTTTHRLVINNLGTTGNDNAYTSSGAQGVITPAGTITYSVSPGTNVCGTALNVHHINIGGVGYQFKSNSPRQRLFVIDANEAPVTYLCDPVAQTLTRYAGYTINNITQPTDPTAAPLNTVPATRTGLVANHVTQCSVTTTTPQVQQRGLVTLALTLADQGETIQLIHQVQLDNSR